MYKWSRTTAAGLGTKCSSLTEQGLKCNRKTKGNGETKHTDHLKHFLLKRHWTLLTTLGCFPQIIRRIQSEFTTGQMVYANISHFS